MKCGERTSECIAVASSFVASSFVASLFVEGTATFAERKATIDSHAHPKGASLRLGSQLRTWLGHEVWNRR
jgi:hypothetical protein